MADPIHHDGASTVATVGSKAVKWGLLGAIASFAIPALVIGAPLFLAGAAIGGVIGSILGGLGIVGGLGAGIAGAAYGGTASMIGGSLLGVAKGGDQISKENAAYRNRGRKNENSVVKAFNDGEIKGIQEGYQIARTDMEPMTQKREQVAFQKGQEFVVHQIQEHMQAQEAGAVPGAEKDKPGKFAGKVALKCESKAEAIIQQREADAMAPKQLG
jgi:hypothetical protein